MTGRGVAIGIGLAVAAFVFVLVAASAMTYFLYFEQSTTVEELEDSQQQQAARVSDLLRDNEQIRAEHTAIGQELAETAKEIRSVVTARKPIKLPLALIPLEKFVRKGFLAPRKLPKQLATDDVRISRYEDGYSLSWPGDVSFFASTRRGQALTLLMQSPASRRTDQIKVGKREITRIRGPWTVYSWKTARHTYAVVTRPRLAELARPLISSVR
jgi:hypothetical protein